MAIMVQGELPPGMVADAYYAELTAVGGIPPYTWEPGAPLPGGLSVVPLPGSERAAIKGVPAGDGSTTFAIKVTDSAGDTVSREFSVRINPQLTISTQDLPSGVKGKRYKAKLKAAGGAGPYTWASSSVPDGLTVNTDTCEIAGPPRQRTPGVRAEQQSR